MLVCHGLTGGASESFVLGLCNHAATKGLRAVVFGRCVVFSYYWLVYQISGGNEIK